MATVNSKFAKLLGERKLKISSVHRLTGISRTTLTKLYYGEGSRISYDVLAKICTSLDCNVEDIFEVQDERGAGSK